MGLQAATKADEAIDILDVIRGATKDAERISKLAPVFLKRDSFAGAATSTGSLCIDFILGGGIPPSRIVGIIGPEHVGKSLLVTDIINSQLKANHAAVFYDAEGSTDPLFLQARGIDLNAHRGRRNKNGELLPKQRDRIFMYQPTTGDEMMNHMHQMMAALPNNSNPSYPTIMFLLDSVIALISDAVATDVDSNKIAMHAQMYAQLIPIINAFLVRSGCSLVYTNQLRQKVMNQFGSDQSEPAGNTLKFFAAIRMMLSREQPKLWDAKHPFTGDGKSNWTKSTPKAGGVWEEPHWDKNGKELGLDRYIYTAVKTIKNKVYTPFQTTWMRVQFDENGSTGRGLDPVFDVFHFLSTISLLKKCVKVKGDGLEAKDLTGRFEFVTTDQFDPKALGMPERFDYREFKWWVTHNLDIRVKLREKLLLSGVAYERAENIKPDPSALEMGEAAEAEEDDAVPEAVASAVE